MQNDNQGNKPAWPWAELPAYRADYRRRNPVPDPGAVVAELANRRQWLIWRYERGESEDKKYRKMPFYAGGGKRFGNQGSDDDRQRLVTLDLAVNAISKGDFDGLGFAFLPGDGLIGIDLDGMIDADSGEVAERCQSIIDSCVSYTEVSPSGKGVHIFCSLEHTPDTKSFKSNKIGVECFIGAQFFTFTGRPWPGSPMAVNALSGMTYRRLQKTVESARPGAASAGEAVAPSSAKPAAAKHGGKQRSAAETVALVEEALTFLSPDDYQQWIDMGMACKAELGTAGFMVWDAWSSKSPKYVATEMAKRWNGFSPSTLTLAALFSRAAEAGWESPWEKAAKRKAFRRPAPAASSAVSETHFDASTAGAGQGGPPGDVPPPATVVPPDEWERDLIMKNGVPTKCLANADLLLSNLPAWKGVIAYDEFAERTVFRKTLPFDLSGPAGGEWTDNLDVRTAIWLQRTFRVEFQPQVVGQAVESLARNNPFHPVRDALNALPEWDGVPRNADWLSDYLGVKKTAYTQLVGRFFLIGMIKRVFEPGCKFDYSLVLEGDQGLGKSTAVRILAWNWFADTDLDLNHKDSLLALPGHWVYEIAEMDSLAKAEASKQKSFLTRQEDEYRPPYGKRMIKVPRQVAFVCTVNGDQYLKDPTGGRRFWPVLCADEFNLDGMRETIKAMYAEALHDYRAGERCFPTKDEQRELFTPEQAKRGMEEPYEDLLGVWLKNQCAPFSMAEAATDGLKLTADKLTPALTTRVGIALRKLGCGRKEDRLAEDPGRRRLYVPPALKHNAVWVGDTPRSVGEVSDVGF